MGPEAVARVAPNPMQYRHPHPHPAGVLLAWEGHSPGRTIEFSGLTENPGGIDSSLLSSLRITAGIKFKQSDLASIRLALVTVCVKRLLKWLHLSGIGAFQPAGQEEARREKIQEVRRPGRLWQ